MLRWVIKVEKSRSSTRKGRNWHFWLCSNVWSSTWKMPLYVLKLWIILAEFWVVIIKSTSDPRNSSLTSTVAVCNYLTVCSLQVNTTASSMVGGTSAARSPTVWWWSPGTSQSTASTGRSCFGQRVTTRYKFYNRKFISIFIIYM